MQRRNSLISFGCLIYCLTNFAFAHPDDAYAHEASDGFTDKIVE